jgi:transposase
MVRSLAAEHTSLSEAQAEIERLHLIIKKLQRSQFGRRAKRLDDEQLHLGFEDIEIELARTEARLHPKIQAPKPVERPSLPAHLPREDIRFDVEGQACPRCGGALHPIGETVSEMIDHVPARLRVPAKLRLPGLRDHPPGTRSRTADCRGPRHPALLAHVLVSKYCNHLPLYRQSQIFARQSVEIDRSTLADWVGGACWWLDPLQSSPSTCSLREAVCRRHPDPSA